MNKRKGLLSVVVPAMNESTGLFVAQEKIVGILNENDIQFEIIFIDDGSSDDTSQVIEECNRRDSRTRGVVFSRNFGKEAAVFAGLSEAKGDCCIVMDADLQHPPQTIIPMYRAWQEGYQVVEGQKAYRGKEGFLYKQSAKVFYSFISKATGVDMSRASDFKLLDRAAVDAILSMPEYHIFFRALSSWVGFKTTSVEFEVEPRQQGETKWSKFSLMSYAVRNVAIFSTAPMQLVTVLGLITMVIAVVVGIQSFFKWAFGTALEGFTTVILLILLFSSVLMISIGIIGYYIARIYDEVKGRPKFIIDRRIGVLPVSGSQRENENK